MTLTAAVEQAILTRTPEAAEHAIREAYDIATAEGRDDIADALGSLLYTDLAVAEPYEALYEIQSAI